MVQSINTKADLVVKGTSYHSFSSYGKIMIGDKGFEFYNDRDAKDYIQIPWLEVDYIIASVLFKGKWIPRYAVKTKTSGTFSFSSKNPKEVLGAMKQYVAPDHMVSSLGFFDIVKRGIKAKRKK